MGAQYTTAVSPVCKLEAFADIPVPQLVTSNVT